MASTFSSKVKRVGDKLQEPGYWGPHWGLRSRKAPMTWLPPWSSSPVPWGSGEKAHPEIKMKLLPRDYNTVD